MATRSGRRADSLGQVRVSAQRTIVLDVDERCPAEPRERRDAGRAAREVDAGDEHLRRDARGHRRQFDPHVLVGAGLTGGDMQAAGRRGSSRREASVTD